MIKQASLLLIILMLGFCSSAPEMERKIEDGIEIILNRSDSDIGSLLFEFKEELVIDFEEDDKADLGISDVWGFDVDSNGNIFVFKPPMSTGNRIVKFDKQGDFVSSFAPPGQGPGEIQSPSYQKMNSHEKLPVADLGQSKIILYDREGHVFDSRNVEAFPATMGGLVFLLDNDNYLIRRTLADPESGMLFLVLSLFNSSFLEIKEMDRYKITQPIKATKVRLPMHVSVWCASKNCIYVGNEDNGYEIHVYDFDGNLKRKIRKEYKPVRVSEVYKKNNEAKLQSAPEILRKKMYFPEFFPPFSFLFTDDQDNLYVKTYKEGRRPKEHLFDVFNPDGIFRGTVSIEAHVNDPFFTPGAPFDSWVVSFKDGRLYALREKSSGYKELVVYRVE